MRKKSKTYGLGDKGQTAIRPEKIVLSRKESGSDLRGEITDIEFRGFYDRVTVVITNCLCGDMTLAVDVPFQTAKYMDFHVHESVYVNLPKEEVLAFE